MAIADLFCFSPIRWSSGFHGLLASFARERRVFFVEAPSFGGSHDGIKELQVAANIWRVAPRLCAAESESSEQTAIVGRLLAEMCERRGIVAPVHWHLTPTTLPLASCLPRSLVVYDRIDELSRSLQQPRLALASAAASPSGSPARKRPPLYSVNATPHGWREATVDRMQRLMSEAESAAFPSPRRLARAEPRPLPQSQGLRGAAFG